MLATCTSVWLLGIVLWLAADDAPGSQRFEFEQVEMAVPMKIALYAPQADAAAAPAAAAFARIHALNAVLSDYDETSELRRLCATAGQGQAVQVSDDLWRVLTCAQEVAQRSEGAFDVTIGPVVRLWRRARRNRELPSPQRLAAARELVGYQHVRLDPGRHTVELLKAEMRLDLGGIAKGYAAAEALKVLRKEGAGQAMIVAGGDIALGDPPPGKPGWRIGVAPPNAQSPPRFYLWLANTAVSTSGDMWQYVDIGGKRYSHVVDPRTGLGLTDHCLVTVIHRDGMLADALSKVLGVLGPEQGLPLIDGTPGAAAFLVRSSGEKSETLESKRWRALRTAPPRDEVERPCSWTDPPDREFGAAP